MNDDFNQTGIGVPQEPQLQQNDPNAELKASHALMIKEIRSWALWSVGLGAVHLLQTGFLDSAWGILLIVVGLASYYYRTSPMFIVYTVTLAWAALSNLVSLNPAWMIFAVIQVYLAFRTFKDFRRFSKIEGEFIQLAEENGIGSRRAQLSFPWIGALMGLASAFGCILYWVLTFVLVATSGANSEPPAYYILLIRLVEIISVMGFSVSLASLLSKHTPKALPIIGIVSGGGMILLFLVVNIIFAVS